MRKIAVISKLALLLFIGGFSFAPDLAVSTSISPAFKGNVTEIIDPLTFKLDCCDAILKLISVKVKNTSDKNITAIEKVLRAHKWLCTARREPKSTKEENTFKVWCSSLDNPMSLSRELFKKKLVIEDCNTSGNQFNTCHK